MEENMNQKEMIEISWEEFKYRHEHFWKSFYKLGFIIIFLIALPHYELKGLLSNFTNTLFILPFTAAFLSILSLWLLIQEQKRLKLISNIYKEHRKGLLQGVKQVIDIGDSINVGEVIIYLSFCGLFIISIADSLLVYFALEESLVSAGVPDNYYLSCK